MFFSMTGEYSSILELMHYFYFEFNIYILLLAIVFIHFFKVIIQYKNLIQKKNKISISIHFSDMIVSALCVLAMGNALMLQGVISDISSEAGEIWLNKVLIVFVLTAILFISQIFITNCIAKKIEK